MPQSVYEGAIMLQAPGQGPTDHFRLDETSGTVANYGVSALALATNGTITRGNDSLLPGDPNGRSTGQSKDTVLATRGDNGLWDRPTTTNKLTLMCWLRPDDLRPGGSGNEYAPLMKGPNVYGLTVAGDSFRSDINTGSAQQLVAEVGALFRPRNVVMLATVFDGAAQMWKLYLNGTAVGSKALPSGMAINHAAGGTLQVGGHNAFGASGIHGRIQQVTVFNAHALSEGSIQNLYRLGVVRPGTEGDEGMYVFPWARDVVAAGEGYKTVQFHNFSPFPVSLSQGGTASMGSGITLAPRGGRLVRPSTFKGAWSAVLNARYGYAVLGIEKTY